MPDMPLHLAPAVPLRETHLALVRDVMRLKALPPYEAIKSAPAVLDRVMRLTGDMVDELVSLRETFDHQLKRTTT